MTPLKDKTFLDLPLLSGIRQKGISPGDTLEEVQLALTILGEANQAYRGMSRRISEIFIERKDRVRLVFTDVRLKALLGSDNVSTQPPLR